MESRSSRCVCSQELLTAPLQDLPQARGHSAMCLDQMCSTAWLQIMDVYKDGLDGLKHRHEEHQPPGGCFDTHMLPLIQLGDAQTCAESKTV